jgi:hypothetical protein
VRLKQPSVQQPFLIVMILLLAVPTADVIRERQRPRSHQEITAIIDDGINRLCEHFALRFDPMAVDYHDQNTLSGKTHGACVPPWRVGRDAP